MEYLWGFLIIGGPIILGLAILYGTIQYRARNRALDRTSDESARRLRKDMERENERQVMR
jgi:hypothetical protein